MKRILYLGLEVPPYQNKRHLVHYPIIKIEPKQHSQPDIQKAFLAFNDYSHLIFTSRTAVALCFDFMKRFQIPAETAKRKTVIAIGKRTAARLSEQGIENISIAEQETAEGVAKHLEMMNLAKTRTHHLFLPQSSLARPVLKEWLSKNKIRHTICSLYDTVPNLSLPLLDLKDFDEIVFTSSSTVHAFLQVYGVFPTGTILRPIGPITESVLFSKI